jgi:hypothetical protein
MATCDPRPQTQEGTKSQQMCFPFPTFFAEKKKSDQEDNEMNREKERPARMVRATEQGASDR